MATYHTVRKGECLSSIAHHYKLAHWQTIYNHPNNADFKKKRPDPNLIYPGDVVYVPDSELREEPRATDKRHVFIAKIPPTFLNVCVQDEADQPVASAPYTLDIGTGELDGVTDAQGWIRHKIPAWAELGTLKVYPDPEDLGNVIEWDVKLGHLDPIDTTSGIKSRLNNLGYDVGEVDDLEDEYYDRAVREFQKDNGLKVDGIVGPKTRACLEKEHRV